MSLILSLNLVVTIRFSQSTYNVDEDDGPAQPVLVLSNPSSTDITVQVFDNDVSATSECFIDYTFTYAHHFILGGVDYDSGPYNVTFPAGVTNVSFDVPITNDNILDDKEIFTLTIAPNSLPSNVTRGNLDQVTIVILDDDCK